MCAELSVPGGRVVMEGDDIPLLTVIRRGKGKMGFFSYDLGEIRGFAEKTPGYVAEILTKTLGQELSPSFTITAPMEGTTTTGAPRAW